MSIDHFWFSWAAFRPETRIYEPPKYEVRMERSLTLILLLATMLVAAACGGSEPGQSGEVTPPQQTESTAQNDTQESVPAETEAAEEAQSGEGDEETAAMSVTTLQGEEVSLGGGGEVTALFFMAGW